MVKKIDFGKETEKVATRLRAHCADGCEKASGNLWNSLIDEAEMEAYDKIKMAPKGQRVVACEVMYH